MIDEDSLNNIERLHKLKADGVISETDFEEAKAKLLAGEGPKKSTKSPDAEVLTAPTDSDHLAWMLRPLKRYADFQGCSSRKEFWMFLLFTNLVSLGLFVLALGIGVELAVAIWLLGFLAILVPYIAVQVRRFHDQGKSGWFAALNLIPYLGAFIVLGFMLVPGQAGDNEYGSDPYS